MPARDSGSEESLIALARSALQSGREALAIGDHAGALRWLERAHRLVPADPNATLTLAAVCLSVDPARSLSLFAHVSERQDVGQAWLGIVAARVRLGQPAEAAEPLAHLLSRHALMLETTALADLVAAQSGYPGWCALRSDGTPEIRATGRARMLIDGCPIRGRALPSRWETARRLEIVCGDTPLLGSPIHIDAIRATAGCVEPRNDGIGGWAWHPGDAARHPTLTLSDARGRVLKTWQADDDSITVPDTGALARPRVIWVPADWLRSGVAPFHIRGPDGRDLPGSPLDPYADQLAHEAAVLHIGALYPAAPNRRRTPPAAAAVLRTDATSPAHPIGADGKRRETTIVIPVHDGGDVVQACLDSVLDTQPNGIELLVVDDGSRDPAVIGFLDALASRGTISLLRHPVALGFPASANAGILAARGRDVILLNSDTLVPPRWIERLREAAYTAPDVGTVTPLSNDASILSYPGAAGTNALPDQAATNRLDRLAVRANGSALVDIPVGVGFCLYMRRDCLNATGVLRADLFAQGYGEETDFCLRARHLGWRHVALTGLFVGHLRGQSFGGSAAHLQARNGRVIERLHPGYAKMIDRFLADDPLAASRRRIDTVAWRERGRQRQSVILTTHKLGGGVERRVKAAAAALAAAGLRPVILRPTESGGVAVSDGIDDDLPNLIFRLPDELALLLRFLRGCRPVAQEVHHLLGYHAAIYDLITRLGVPRDVHVHDYAWFCPRVVLIGGHGRYCGEPDLLDCEACVADHGHDMREDVPVATLRERSSAILLGAHRVVTPSDDTGRRMRRHFPGLSTETVPHADDTIFSGPAPRSTAAVPKSGRRLVCVVGGIGTQKGFDVLLACARDAQRRELDLGFVVVGYTLDDMRMIATGRVFVTGVYKPHEAVELIRQQQADIGFIPSISPETWCLGLDELWQAGLSAAAFDIGAPAERIRQSGRGFLLPLGLSTSAINNSLIAAMGAARH